MGMNLTVNRQKLIDQLTAKRAEIIAHYDTQITKLTERLESFKNSNEAWADYYAQVSQGLAAGTLKMSDTGKIVASERGGVVPDKPNAKSPRNRWHGSRADIEKSLTYVQEGGYYRSQDLQGYDSALQLLELSDDESIVIDGADYNGLLSRGFRRWNWDD
jgi:hypothetical protein